MRRRTDWIWSWIDAYAFKRNRFPDRVVVSREQYAQLESEAAEAEQRMFGGVTRPPGTELQLVAPIGGCNIPVVCKDTPNAT